MTLNPQKTAQKKQWNFIYPSTNTQILLLQAQLSCLQLSLILDKDEEEKKKSKPYLIPPEPVQEAAKMGLELYRQFGGCEELIISETLASGNPITMAQAEKIWQFFECKNIDERQPGWRNNHHPCADWIQWQLMGGFEGYSWVEIIKELDETMKTEPLIP